MVIMIREAVGVVYKAGNKLQLQPHILDMLYSIHPFFSPPFCISLYVLGRRLGLNVLSLLVGRWARAVSSTSQKERERNDLPYSHPHTTIVIN